MSDHAITWTHVDDSIVGTITCTAAPDSWCRMECATQECSEWDALHEHGLTDSGHCQALEWFEVSGMESSEFGPDDGDVRSGPIEVRWNGHDWEWDYADQPAPARGAPVPTIQGQRWCAHLGPDTDGVRPFCQIAPRGHVGVHYGIAHQGEASETRLTWSDNEGWYPDYPGATP